MKKDVEINYQKTVLTYAMPTSGGGIIMTVKPLGDRILVKEKKAENKSSSGLLHIPESAQEKTQSGIVVAIGDDKEVITVSVGQTVMYEKFTGTAVKIDNEDHLIVHMGDLIAVID